MRHFGCVPSVICPDIPWFWRIRFSVPPTRPFSFPYRHYRLFVSLFRPRLTSRSRWPALSKMAADSDVAISSPSAPPSPPVLSGQPQVDLRQENTENHKTLKRPYEQLERESISDTPRPGERNVRIRAETDNASGELEKTTQPGPNGFLAQKSSLPATADDSAISSTSQLIAQNTKAATLSEGESVNARPLVNGGLAPVPVLPKNDASAVQHASSVDVDVEMANGTSLAENHSHPKAVVPLPPAEGVASTVESSTTLTASNTTGALSDARGTQAEKHTQISEHDTQQSLASSSTLANALGQSPSNSTTTPPTQTVNGKSLASAQSTVTPPSHNQIIHSATSMENILKVAEAAVAAQNAAKLAAMTSASPTTPADSNSGPSSTNGAATPTIAAKPTPPPVNTKSTTPNATAGSSTTSAATPSSSLSNNPYLSLSTNLLARTPGATTPTHHMLMPYPLFYPPGTPVTPNSPAYPIPYNPYYYLAAPMPGPNGMYPLPPTFPSPAQQQQQRPPPSANQQGGKPKRLKSHTVTTKSFSIPMVPRDRGGKPMLPLNVGIMTVINLGEICVREHFHTERYIFPVGYEVTRRYLSTLNPNIEVVYHCTILDGGDGPKFQIIPSDRPDKPIIAGTATGAWSNIVKQANAIRNRQHSNSVSGPDFFGLGQNTIKHLLQELPNSDRLRDYVWQNFVEGGPLGGRHAAVIPALPEEWDSSMPLGAYYPKRDSNPNPGVARGLSHYPRHIIAQAEAQKAARLAEEQTQLQQQQQPIAGPSGLGSASSPATASQHINQHELPHIMLSLGATTGGSLNIQEYQPPLNQSHTADKRTTRSDGVTNTNSASSPSAPARSTRAQGNHQQPQQQATPVNGAETSALNADGSMATTFASIMNAYPVPGVSTPQMSGQPTASTS